MSKSKKKANRKTKVVRTPKKRGTSSSQNNWWLIGVLAITAVLFIPSIQNDWVNWDDDVNVLENPNLERFNGESIQHIFHLEKGSVIGNYNPLTIFTFAIENALVGHDATLYHINNLILHLLCCFFVYKIMIALGLSPIGAAIVTLLFGIHPMRVESVAWITERKDVLFGVFFLAALYRYLNYVKSGAQQNKWLWIIGILFILSLLSKIQAVALPLTMLAVDYYLKRPFDKKLVLEKIPFFLLSLFFGLLGIYSLSQQGSLDDSITQFGFLDRLRIGGYSYVVYLIKAIIPYKMVAMYPYPSSLNWHFIVGPIVAIASLGLVYWWYKQEKRALVFAWLIFFFNVVFMLQILGAGQGFIADRFTYIPYLGLFFLVGYYYDKYKNSNYHRVFQIVLSIVFLFYAFLTFNQIKTWKNGETLWTHVMNNVPTSTLPYSNRGHYYRERKMFDKALVDYSKAISIQPEKAPLYNSRGKTYFDMGKVDLAIQDYEAAIERDSEHNEFYTNYGAALGAKGRIQDALQALNKSIALDPTFENAYLNRSLAYNELGLYQEALQDIDTYLGFKPYNGEMWFEKGMAHRFINQAAESIPAFDKALQYAPNHPQVGLFYYNRGRSFLSLNNKAAAQADFRKAQQYGIEIEDKYK